MAGSVNKVILVGNLGRDPEAKNFENGGSLVNVSLATTEFFKNQAGERESKTEWHRLVIRRPQLIEVATKYLRKGMSVYVEGRLVTRSWTKEGATHYSTEVVVDNLQMLSAKQDDQSTGGGQEAEAVNATATVSDDLPF